MAASLKKICSPRVYSPTVHKVGLEICGGSTSSEVRPCISLSVHSPSICGKYQRKYLEVPSPRCLGESPGKCGTKCQLLDEQNKTSAKTTKGLCRRPSVNTPDRKALLHQGLEDTTDMKILGRGSFGVVVEGVYKDACVAVKVVPKRRSSSTSSLHKEQNALNLSHPNVVRILQVSANEGPYGIIVMEQCDGSTLQQLIDDQSFRINHERRISFCLDIARALKYCHEEGVLHLDVKPSNVLVSGDGHCKLCDFGSSKGLRNATEGDCTVPGTILYTSPEVLKGKVPTTKADVYALGITMWQLLSRQVPYQGEESYSVIYKVVSKMYRPKDIEMVSTGVAEYIELYKWSWKQVPEDRPTMMKITQELQGIR